jgi:hypothetical protein
MLVGYLVHIVIYLPHLKASAVKVSLAVKEQLFDYIKSWE